MSGTPTRPVWLGAFRAGQTRMIYHASGHCPALAPTPNRPASSLRQVPLSALPDGYRPCRRCHDTGAVTLLPVAERDALVQELVETNEYVDPLTGEPIEFDGLPVVDDDDGDEDEDEDAR